MPVSLVYLRDVMVDGFHQMHDELQAHPTEECEAAWRACIAKGQWPKYYIGVAGLFALGWVEPLDEWVGWTEVDKSSLRDPLRDAYDEAFRKSDA